MKEKLLFEKFSKNIIHTGYYPLLFILSCTWMIYYRPGLNGISMVSFIAQQAALFSLLQITDTILTGRRIKYCIAGLSAIYIFLLHFNAFLLSITSITLYESVTILAIGGDFLYTLEEAGLSAGYIMLLVLLLMIILAGGGAVYRYMPHADFRGRASRTALILIFITSALFFIVEQVFNRNDSDFFSRRLYPLYIEIFSSNNDTVTLSIPENRFPMLEEYHNITRPVNHKNVLFILLESFRSDSINSELSPAMNELSAESLEFANYFTDAIYTSLAWNTILMDRPAYTLPYDISYDRENRRGSGIFRIFKNAGYDTFAAFSANMEWKNFYNRVNGEEKLIGNYFCGFKKRDEERNYIDNRTCAKSIEWITKSGHEKPFFMMIQLDSTHWTYYAGKENELSKPFAGKDVNIGKLRNEKDIVLLLNRYKNSIRQVNSSIAKIMAALKQSGKYNDTAIIIVSDHGEGFSPGMIGHSVMHDHIKKPAIIIHLPGIEKFRMDKFISHMDIFPTVFDYLKIGGTEKIMRGRSILSKNNNRKCVLSFHGSLLMADLTFNDYIVFFRVARCKNSITFTPVKYTDRSGNIIKEHESSEWKSSLKQIIENN